MCYIVFMIMIKYVLTLNDNKYYLSLKKREGILQMRLVFIFITVNLLKKNKQKLYLNSYIFIFKCA